MKQKVLITGVLGYVGSVLIDQLKNDNYILSGLDNGYFANCNFNDDFQNEIFLNDITFCDIRNLNPAILDKGFDVVVNLLAISNDPIGNQFNLVTDDICIKYGVKKFIFASSCSVYGDLGSKKRSELDPVNPLTIYAKSKIQIETYLKSVSSENFKAISLRFATACGWSKRFRVDLVLNDFVLSSILNNRIDLLSSGLSYRPLISVLDMSKVINFFIKHDPSEFYNCFNSGSDEWNYKIIDLANQVSEICGHNNVNVKDNNAVDNRSYKVDFSKLKNYTNNEIKFLSITDVVKEMVDEISNSSFEDLNFRKSKFSRLSYLNFLISKKYINKNLEWI
jgi:nucleoside-diphosphate-sugar epimerase